MANLTGALNRIRSTVSPAMKWAAEQKSYRMAGRLAYSPMLGGAGALIGGTAGSLTADKSDYKFWTGSRHMRHGAMKGAALGAMAGFRLSPRLTLATRELGAGNRAAGLLGPGR